MCYRTSSHTQTLHFIHSAWSLWFSFHDTLGLLGPLETPVLEKKRQSTLMGSQIKRRRVGHKRDKKEKSAG